MTAAPIAVLVIDISRDVIEFASGSVSTLLGHSPLNVTGMTTADVFANASPAVSVLLQQLVGEAPADTAVFDLTLGDAGGAGLVCRCRAQVGQPPDGHRRVVLIVENSHAGTDVDRRLDASERMLRLAFDEAPAGMALTEVDERGRHTIVQANQALADILRLERDQLIGRDLGEFAHPDDLAHAIVGGQAIAIGAQQTFSHELRCRRGDGTIGWAEVRATVVDQPAAGRTRAIAHVLDVTERHLMELQHQLRAMVDTFVVELTAAVLADTAVDEIASRIASFAARLVGSGMAAVVHRNAITGTYSIDAKTGDIEPSTWVATLQALLDTPSIKVEEDMVIGSTVLVQVSATDVAACYVSSITYHAPIETYLVVAAAGTEDLVHLMTEALDHCARQLCVLLELADAVVERRQLALLNDRERIARDIHDSVVQELFAVGLQLAVGGSRLPDSQLRAQRAEMVGRIDETIRRLRRAIFDLHPQPAADAAEKSVSELVTSLIVESSRALGHRPSLVLVGRVDEIDPAVVEQLLPTVRESLSNIIRHAQATNTAVSLEVNDDTIHVSIDDDGIGVPPVPIHRSGIDNIIRRAALLGGVATVELRPEGGTHVGWIVPRSTGVATHGLRPA